MSPQRLALDLRESRPAAIRKLRAVLERAGSMRAAAPVLGISYATLWRWSRSPDDDARAIPAVGDLVAELGMRDPAKSPRK